MFKPLSVISKFATIVSLLAMSQTTLAQSQSDMTFENGAVVIHCKAINDNEIPESVFEAAFPLWITNLQILANSGKILRAHYLPNFRSGIFIVVNGETIKEAKENAENIVQKNAEILDDALKKLGMEGTHEGEDTCELIEIGPVAILPQ